MLPDLPEGLSEFSEEKQLDWVNVQHVGVPWLDGQKFLFKFWIRDAKFISISYWPTHPIGLHVGVERYFSSLKVNVRPTNEYPNDGKHRNVVIAWRCMIISLYDNVIWLYSFLTLFLISLFLPVLHNNMNVFYPIKHEDENQKHTIEECR